MVASATCKFLLVSLMLRSRGRARTDPSRLTRFLTCTKVRDVRFSIPGFLCTRFSCQNRVWSSFHASISRGRVDPRVWTSLQCALLPNKSLGSTSFSPTDFILSGPLIGSPGLDVDTVMSDQDDWNAVADRLIEQLGFQAGRLNGARLTDPPEIFSSDTRRTQQTIIQPESLQLPLFLNSKPTSLSGRPSNDHSYMSSSSSFPPLLPLFPADAQRARVYQYYVPVFKWIEGQLKGCRDKPLVIGISAPQGCGKSTLVEQLELLFKW